MAQLDEVNTMVNALTGIKNFLQLINDNWMLIIAIIGLLIGLYQKIKKFLSLTTEEKIVTAKEQVRAAILKLITDAEMDYHDWVKAGEIKRSQVIKQIYADFPILNKVQNQDELIAWIDVEIDNALKTLRKVIEDNDK